MTHLNDLFKKKLSEQQFDGKEKYWAQLNKKLTEHAQEKVVIAWYKKWLLPLFAIIVAGAASIYYFNSSNNSEVSKSNFTKTQKESLSTAQESVQNTEPHIVSDISNSTSSNSIAHSKANQVSEKVQNESLNAIPEKADEVINAISTQHKFEKTNPKHQITATSVSNSNQNHSIDEENNLMTEQNLKQPQISDTEIIEMASAIGMNSLAQNFKTQISTEKPNNDVGLNSQNTIESSKTTAFNKAQTPLFTLSSKALVAMPLASINSDIKMGTTSINHSKSKPLFSLSVYGGAMFSIKNLLSTNGNTVEYLNRRKNEEGNSVKPNAGIDVELKSGHWTITSGINFHQQGETRKYSDNFKRNIPYDSLVININDHSAWLVDSTVFYSVNYNNIYTSTDTTVTFYDESSGLFYTASMPINVTQSVIVDTNYYYLIDSSYHQEIDTVKTTYALTRQQMVKDPNQAHLKGKNTFSYVEVPILLGYEWGIRRWRLSVKAGVGIGLLTRQQSFYLSNDESEIAPVSTSVYTKLMYNAVVRAGLHYNFTPQLGIDIVPFSRININNMTDKNATFQQKYYNLGLQLGFNFKL